MEAEASHPRPHPPTGCEFKVLQEDRLAGESGGGSFVFEVSVPGKRPMRAEAVIIDPKRKAWEEEEGGGRGATVCVSSQAGCALDCAFCDTGLVKPVSNLPAWSIVEQVIMAQKMNPNIQRVVFMGMGEPLMNYRSISEAIGTLRERVPVLARKWAITVSTVGVVPKLKQLADDHPEVALAVSLHAPTQELRSRLLPAAAGRWPLEEVMQAAAAHEESTGRRTMFAYTVLPGVNDGEENARELASLLHANRQPGTSRPLVNLVPYNRTEAGERFAFRAPRSRELRDFQAQLRQLGIRSTIRWGTAEGRPIQAACGQLTGQLQRQPTLGANLNVETVETGKSAIAADEEKKKQESEETTDGETQGVPAPVLTRLLTEAGSAEELLSLTAEHLEEMNSIHVSAALLTLGRTINRHPDDRSKTRARTELFKKAEFKALLQRSEDLLVGSSAHCCANFFVAFAKLRFRPRGTLRSRLLEATTTVAPELLPQSVANVLDAFVRLRCFNDAPERHACLSALKDAFERKMPQLTRVEFTNSMKAIAKLGLSINSARAAAIAEAQAPQYNVQDAISLLWAFGEMRSPLEQGSLPTVLRILLDNLEELQAPFSDRVRILCALEHVHRPWADPALGARGEEDDDSKKRCSSNDTNDNDNDNESNYTDDSSSSNQRQVRHCHNDPLLSWAMAPPSEVEFLVTKAKMTALPSRQNNSNNYDDDDDINYNNSNNNRANDKSSTSSDSNNNNNNNKTAATRSHEGSDLLSDSELEGGLGSELEMRTTPFDLVPTHDLVLFLETSARMNCSPGGSVLEDVSYSLAYRDGRFPRAKLRVWNLTFVMLSLTKLGHRPSDHVLRKFEVQVKQAEEDQNLGEHTKSNARDVFNGLLQKTEGSKTTS